MVGDMRSLFPSEIPKSKSGMLCVRVYGDLRECIRAWAARNQILNKLPRVVAVTVKHLASECKKIKRLTHVLQDRRYAGKYESGAET
jgi:hypothetical protein